MSAGCVWCILVSERSGMEHLGFRKLGFKKGHPSLPVALTLPVWVVRKLGLRPGDGVRAYLDEERGCIVLWPEYVGERYEEVQEVWRKFVAKEG